MLEKILRLYSTSMHTGVTSPLPHLVGPPGSGKSTVVRQAADLVGVRMHTMNVSRISPLELEGVAMPVTTEEQMKLKLLHAPLWKSLKPGDILLLDEFLRGFPEVYNGLLDILTSREVAGLVLPDVFFIAASNSVITYDMALEDRLLHITVPDPRKSKAERKRLANLIIEGIGLSPGMVDSVEMARVMSEEIEPMFEMLDSFTGKKKHTAGSKYEGRSVRHLIGQAKLREVQSEALRELIDFNNQRAIAESKMQYIVLLDGKHPPAGYEIKAAKFKDLDKLTKVQRENAAVNLELIGFEQARHINRTGGTAT